MFLIGGREEVKIIKDIQEAGLEPEMTLSTRDLEGILSKREEKRGKRGKIAI